MADPSNVETGVDQAALAALGLAGAFKFFQSAGLHSAANPLPAMAVEGLGARVRPGGFIPRPTPLALTWALPQPFGFTPPEYLGLEKDYLFGLDPVDLVEHGAERGAVEKQQAVVANQAAKQLAVIAERSRTLNADELNAALAVVSQIDQLRAQSDFLKNNINITHAASVLEAEKGTRDFLRERGLDQFGQPLPEGGHLKPPAPGNDAAAMQRLQANNPPDP